MTEEPAFEELVAHGRAVDLLKGPLPPGGMVADILRQVLLPGSGRTGDQAGDMVHGGDLFSIAVYRLYAFSEFKPGNFNGIAPFIERLLFDQRSVWDIALLHHDLLQLGLPAPSIARSHGLEQARVHAQGGMTDIPGELHDGGTGGKEDIQLIVFVVQQRAGG